MGWSAGLLAHEDGINDFGPRHRYLRPLGDGWQMVEIGLGWSEPPELGEPCRRLAKSTGRPVFAAAVHDSDYAVLGTAAGDEVGGPTIVNDYESPCCDEHERTRRPGPTNRPLGEVVAELVHWCGAAGLPGDARAIEAALMADVTADDLVFGLVRALGVPTIGRTLPRSVPVDQWPFSSVGHLFLQTQIAAVNREADGSRMKPWETAAVDVHAEVWAAAYRPDVDLESLARRIIEAQAAYDRARGKTGQRDVDLRELTDLLTADRLMSHAAEDSARASADRRAISGS